MITHAVGSTVFDTDHDPNSDVRVTTTDGIFTVPFRNLVRAALQEPQETVLLVPGGPVEGQQHPEAYKVTTEDVRAFLGRFVAYHRVAQLEAATDEELYAMGNPELLAWSQP